MISTHWVINRAIVSINYFPYPILRTIYIEGKEHSSSMRNGYQLKFEGQLKY